MQTRLLLPLLLALGVGFAAGAWWSSASTRWTTSPAPKLSPTISATPAASSTTSTASGLADILRDSDPLHRTEGLVKYVESLPPSALEDAIAHTPSTEDQALTLLTTRWSEVDPQGALDAIPRLKDIRAQYLLSQAVFGQLTAASPDHAMETAQQMPNQRLRNAAEEAVIEQVAMHDPAAALKIYTDNESAGTGALKAIFDQWAQTDLHAATDAALKLASPGNRDYMIQTIALRLQKDDPAAALAWLDNLQLINQDHTRSMIVGEWARSNPAAAAQYVSTLPTFPFSAYNSIMAQSVASMWAQNDPRDAAAWARTLTGDHKRGALQSALIAWGRDDPQAVAAYWGSLGDDPKTQDFLVHCVASAITPADPQAALAWVGQMPAGTMHNDALQAVMLNWADSSPAAAAAYIQTLPEGDTRNTATAQVATQWANKDPAGAAQWIASLPESAQKGQIMTGLVHSWAQADPSTASAWLSQLPAGADRDTAAGTFSEDVFAVDPDAALRWAEAIGNESSRSQHVNNILNRWISGDPAGASAAIQRSSLPPDQKNRLLSQLK